MCHPSWGRARTEAQHLTDLALPREVPAMSVIAMASDVPLPRDRPITGGARPVKEELATK